MAEAEDDDVFEGSNPMFNSRGPKRRGDVWKSADPEKTSHVGAPRKATRPRSVVLGSRRHAAKSRRVKQKPLKQWNNHMLYNHHVCSTVTSVGPEDPGEVKAGEPPISLGGGDDGEGGGDEGGGAGCGAGLDSGLDLDEGSGGETGESDGGDAAGGEEQVGSKSKVAPLDLPHAAGNTDAVGASPYHFNSKQHGGATAEELRRAGRASYGKSMSRGLSLKEQGGCCGMSVETSLTLGAAGVGFLLVLAISIVGLVIGTSGGAPVTGFAVLVPVGSLVAAAVLGLSSHFALRHLTGRVEVRWAREDLLCVLTSTGGGWEGGMEFAGSGWSGGEHGQRPLCGALSMGGGMLLCDCCEHIRSFYVSS